MSRDDDIARAIRQKDIQALVRIFFEGDPPFPRSGFRTETHLWDYKSDCPKLIKEHENSWADVAKEVLGFHNKGGGVLFFGINNSFAFTGATTRLDSKLVNDKLRKYLGDSIWVEYHREFIRDDQRYLGVALIPPRGPILERFKCDSPVYNGLRLFEKGGTAIREGDSTRVLSKVDSETLSRSISSPTLGQTYAVDDPFFRILQPEYTHFVCREKPCQAVSSALHDRRTAITSLIGIGGVGKTALATWAVLRDYETRCFNFIVSMTAKDRELTSWGIKALTPPLTSFETLLDSVVNVLGFPELKSLNTSQKEAEVRTLLEDSNGLLYVDNLETVDDARIINFLETLPIGVRAIVTSRRSRVRVAARPVEIEVLNDKEANEFIQSLTSIHGLAYCANLSESECARIRSACDGIPLVIRWALTKSQNAQEALATAEAISTAGRRGDELLEFCFRRIFDQMPTHERIVLEVLSLFQRPLPLEAILVGSGTHQRRVTDAIDQLVEDALITRFFDPDNNDYSYALLPITRTFVYSEVAKKTDREQKIRQQLTDYFEARDISDTRERLVIREIRQGKTAPDAALLDLAMAAARRGDISGAQQLFDQALIRNPHSWRAAQKYAEFQRHKLLNHAQALGLYEQAAANAPRMGSDRALIYREWGMLLRDSGGPNATDDAIEKFEIALRETPHDVVTITALAKMYDRKGFYSRVLDLVAPLREHSNEKTRNIALPLLLRAYEKTGDMLKAAEIRPLVNNIHWTT